MVEPNEPVKAKIPSVASCSRLGHIQHSFTGLISAIGRCMGYLAISSVGKCTWVLHVSTLQFSLFMGDNPELANREQDVAPW